MRHMKGRPHLLRVAQEPASFAPLFAALTAAGLRCGWLELRRPGAPPPGLEAAAALGAARAVAAGDGRSVAVKALRGAPVLRDLLREHFAGCTLVLVAGSGADGADGADGDDGDDGAAPPTGPLAAAPELRAEGEGWRVAPPGVIPAAGAADSAPGMGAAAERLDTAHLVARLRRPRPWASEDAAPPAAPPPAGSAAPAAESAEEEG
jgi:hypothetical protein